MKVLGMIKPSGHSEIASARASSSSNIASNGRTIEATFWRFLHTATVCFGSKPGPIWQVTPESLQCNAVMSKCVRTNPFRSPVISVQRDQRDLINDGAPVREV